MLRTLRFDRFYALVLQVETHLQVVGPKDREGPDTPHVDPQGALSLKTVMAVFAPNVMKLKKIR